MTAGTMITTTSSNNTLVKRTRQGFTQFLSTTAYIHIHILHAAVNFLEAAQILVSLLFNR